MAHLKTRGHRSHVDAAQIFKRHITEAWPGIAGAPAVDLKPHQVLDMPSRLIEAGEGRTANKLRSYLLLAANGVTREVRGPLRSHGLTGVQARHYDGHDCMPEKRQAIEILVREVCRVGNA